MSVTWVSHACNFKVSPFLAVDCMCVHVFWDVRYAFYANFYANYGTKWTNLQMT